jgi:hypothetical protein
MCFCRFSHFPSQFLGTLIVRLIFISEANGIYQLHQAEVFCLTEAAGTRVNCHSAVATFLRSSSGKRTNVWPAELHVSSANSTVFNAVVLRVSAIVPPADLNPYQTYCWQLYTAATSVPVNSSNELLSFQVLKQ